MTTLVTPALPLSDPVPLAAPDRTWTRWLGPLISLALLAVVLLDYSRFELRADTRLLAAAPAFWVLFVLYFLCTALWEWVIYRRLWNIPASGIAALLRKDITNELLLGYLGEVYFYAWARQRVQLTAAPFGAIKDVAILSAMVANLVTLALLPLGLALLGNLPPQVDPLALKLSTVAFLATSLIPLLLRRRLFSLPRADLWFVAGIHALRVVCAIALYAWLWHLLLPTVAIGWWIALAALRQLVSRLPLAPGRDVLFAAIAAFFVGRHSEVAALLALLATLTVAFQIAVGAVLGATGLIERTGR